MAPEQPSGSSLTDPERLALLHRSGLLEDERIEVFDRLARAASRALRAPVAQLNLITGDRRVSRACHGPEPWCSGRPVDFDQSLCQHAVSAGRPLVVNDARQHPLARHSRITTELGVHAYLGVPLVVGGHALGTLCVLDFEPRTWTAQEIEVLSELASVAATEIEERLLVRNSAQAALRESESRYRTLAAVNPDAILEMDENSIILSANPAVERIFGYRPDELVGQPMLVLIPEHLRAAHRAGVERYLATGQRGIPWDGVELPAVTKSGREITTEIAFGTYTIEGRRVFAGFVRDVTERKRAERLRSAEHGVTRALSESHTLEQAAPRVLQAMGEMLGWSVGLLWVVQSDAPVLRCVGRWHEPAAQVPRFMEASAAAAFARGVGLPGRVWQQEAPLWLRDVQTDANFPRAPVAAEEGLHAAIGFPLHSSDEFLGVIEFFAHEIHEPDPDLLRMVEAIGADVALSIRRVQAEEARDRALAELARLNADLQLANEQLEERSAEAEAASQAKSDFMATMSHELRTPLNAVIGYSDLLLAGVPEEIPLGSQKQVRRIGLSARHLLELIDEILTFARAEAGREVVQLDTLDVGQLLEEVEAVVEPLAHNRGLDFRVIRPAYPLVVRTDAGKVRQILLQLLSNAVKFTEQGTIELTAGVKGADLVFTVRDTGIGISQHDQLKIFEPFWQVEQSTTRSVEGAGLGLSVSQRLAELLNGQIRVQSVPGEGSVFTVVLPLAEEAPSSVAG